MALPPDLKAPGRLEEDVKDEISVCRDVPCASLLLDGRMVCLDSVSKEFDGTRPGDTHSGPSTSASYR